MNREEKWSAVLHTAQVVTSSLKLNEILDLLIKQLMEVIDAADAGVIFLYHSETNRLIPQTGFGFNMEYLKYLRLKPGEAMTGKTFVEQKAQIFTFHDDTSKGMQNIELENRKYYMLSLSGYKPPESTICAPLIFKKQCIGVMTIGSFSKSIHFSNDDLELLETISHHAAIAIENSRLYEKEREQAESLKKLHYQLQEKNLKLNKAMSIQSKLTAIALEGKGVSEICKTLASLIHKQILVVDSFYQVRGSSVDPSFESELMNNLPKDYFLFDHTKLIEIEGISVLKRSIYASEELLGYLIIVDNGTDTSDELTEMACELAVTVFSLELIKQESLQELKLRMEGNLIDDILQGNITATFLDRFNSLIDRSTPSKFIMAILQIDPYVHEDIERLLREKRILFRIIQYRLQFFPYRALLLEKNESFFILFSFPVNCPLQLANQTILKTIESIQKEVKEKRLLFSFSAGVGREATHHSSIIESFRDAKICIDYLHSNFKRDSIFLYHQLGINILFYQNRTSDLKRYVEDRLYSIIEYDELNGTDLIETLQAYFEFNRAIQKTAQYLNIHPNTLHYRLKKIEELLNMTESKGKDWLQIQIAIELYQYLKSQGNHFKVTATS